MKKLLILIAVCGFFAIASPALAADGTITGTVTHAADGSVIPSMFLSAQDVSAKTYTYAVADASGVYSFTLAPGTYDVSPYTNINTEPSVTFMKKSLTITVASGETKSGNNFALTRRGRFVGHVYASDGVTTLSNASLSFTSTNGYLSGSGSAVTVSDGTYIATPINVGDAGLSAVGAYTLYVTRPGYFSALINNVTLSADESDTTKDITLTPASAVTGTITASDGSALSAATAMVTKSTGQSYIGTTGTDGSFSVAIYDSFSYNGSAIGDYTLSVSKSGYVTKTAALSIDAEATTVAGQNFSLVTGGTISGKVSASSGSALSGVLVLANDGFGNNYSATTDASGNYALTSLNPSARYTVTVTKNNYVGQRAYPVKATSGGTLTKNFSMPAAKSYTGTILAKSNNAALEGATISLFKRNKTRTEIADLSFTSKSNGSFAFRNVSPGNYRIKIVKTGYVTIVIDSVNINTSLANRIYKMDAAGTIVGRVYTGKSTGIASADISVYAENNGKEVALMATSADENGYYAVTGLKKGIYRIRVASADYVTTVVKIGVNTGAQATANIKMAPAGSVTGTVIDKDTGLPVSVVIRVVGTSITAGTDANGYFVLDGIPPGKRKIIVISPYYDIPGARDVNITAGKIITDFNYSLNQKR